MYSTDISQVVLSCAELARFGGSFSSLAMVSSTKSLALLAIRACCRSFFRILVRLGGDKTQPWSRFCVCFVFEPSCRPRWWLDVANGGDDLPKQRSIDCDLGQLERDLARMAHNPCPKFDQAALDTCQRPIRDFFGQVGTLW